MASVEHCGHICRIEWAMDDLVDLLTYRCPITNGWRCAVPESALASHGYKPLGLKNALVHANETGFLATYISRSMRPRPRRPLSPPSSPPRSPMPTTTLHTEESLRGTLYRHAMYPETLVNILQNTCRILRLLRASDSRTPMRTEASMALQHLGKQSLASRAVLFLLHLEKRNM